MVAILFVALPLFAPPSELFAADAAVQALADQVSLERYTGYQQTIESMGLGKYAGPLYNQGSRGRGWKGKIGDKGNQETRLFLADTLHAMGLTVAVQGKYLNVVAEQRGTVHPEKVLIIDGHYDSYSSTVPGGDDNASGTAGMLEAARVLSGSSFEYTIRYIGFNTEELNLNGSLDYVKNVVSQNNEEIIGVLDLDQILAPFHVNNPSIPAALGVSTGSNDPAAAAWASTFMTAAKTYVPALPIGTDSPFFDDQSDHYSFAANGYPAALEINDYSANDTANPYYETPDDASDGAAGKHYDFTFATNTVRAIVACMAQEAHRVGASNLRPQPLDTDGDGYADEIETALNSDPLSATSRPLGLSAAVTGNALTLTSVQVMLDFTGSSNDRLSLSGTLPVATGFVPAGTTVIVDVAGVVASFSLDARGNATSPLGGSFALKLKRSGGVVPAQLASFTCKLSGLDFKAHFIPLGMINGDISRQSVSIPATVILNGEVHTGGIFVHYSAVKGASGLAK